jgi:hypothetical protein
VSCHTVTGACDPFTSDLQERVTFFISDSDWEGGGEGSGASSGGRRLVGWWFRICEDGDEELR